MLKKIFYAILIALLVLAAIITIKTLTYKSLQVQATPVPLIQVGNEAAEHLAGAIKIPTVSNEDSSQFDSVPFLQMHEYLKKTYPLTDSLVAHETVNKYSLLYKWTGTDATAKPILLLAHMDVVPVEEVSMKQWVQLPFSGNIADGYVWGRGSIDDKLSVIGIMESVERLLHEGYKPARTVYLAFGHDEEISGRNGAAQIAALLKSRGVHAELALDEGMSITKGMVPGIKKDVALIGIAEKGFVTTQLTCHVNGGHSSMPAKETNIGVLSTAIAKLQAQPFPAHISPATQQFMDHVGPEMSTGLKMLFANMWLFKRVFISEMDKTSSGSATLRTTTAPTIFKSGVKENVLPTEATASVNFRILPGETVASVIAHVKEIINDPRIEVKAGQWSKEPSPISSTESAAYKNIETTIRQLWPNAIVSPSLVLGGTDSRNYIDVADNIYRFQPIPFSPDDLTRLHGINERMGVEDFKAAVNFYYLLIKNTTK